MLRPPPRLALDTRGGWPSPVFVCGPSLAEVVILGALVSQQGFSMRCAQHLVTRSSIGVSYRVPAPPLFGAFACSAKRGGRGWPAVQGLTVSEANLRGLPVFRPPGSRKGQGSATLVAIRHISPKIATALWGDKRRSEFRREFSFIAPQRGLMGARGSGYCAQQTFWIRLPGRPEAERNASEGTTYLKKPKRTDRQATSSFASVPTI